MAMPTGPTLIQILVLLNLMHLLSIPSRIVNTLIRIKFADYALIHLSYTTSKEQFAKKVGWFVLHGSRYFIVANKLLCSETKLDPNPSPDRKHYHSVGKSI